MKKSKKTSLNYSQICSKIQVNHKIIGREKEILDLIKLINAERNVLIEGPVGVGKTAIAKAVADELGKKVIRVDGDHRFTEQKLTGWFDPALLMKSGFSKRSFISGPLVKCMTEGSILFVNELNRMPESVQNVLLPAIDEGIISIPQLGEIKASSGFLLLATQNPRDFVATAHLSEALLDRLEWLHLDYQKESEEKEIVSSVTGFKDEPALSYIVGLVRKTRSSPLIKRGASVRAAIAMAKIIQSSEPPYNEDVFLSAALAAIPNRIELTSQEMTQSWENLFKSILAEIIEDLKKKA